MAAIHDDSGAEELVADARSAYGHVRTGNARSDRTTGRRARTLWQWTVFDPDCVVAHDDVFVPGSIQHVVRNDLTPQTCNNVARVVNKSHRKRRRLLRSASLGIVEYHQTRPRERPAGERIAAAVVRSDRPHAVVSAVQWQCHRDRGEDRREGDNRHACSKDHTARATLLRPSHDQLDRCRVFAGALGERS